MCKLFTYIPFLSYPSKKARKTRFAILYRLRYKEPGTKYVLDKFTAAVQPL